MGRYVDFEHVHANVDLVAAAEWLGLNPKRKGEGYRCECPECGSGRALSLTPSSGLWHCWGCDRQAPTQPKDVIQLTAKIKKMSVRDAALALQDHFLDVRKKVGSVENPLQKIDYLDPTHPLVEELGVSKEEARALGIGYAPKGTMIKRVLFPLRDERGKLVGYIGVNPQLNPPVKLPSKLHV